MLTDTLPCPINRAAEARFADAFAEPLRENNYWRLAALVLTVAVLALIALNWRLSTQQKERIVVRVDEIGRAQAIGYTSQTYMPGEAEMKYFLTHFVTDYYSRQATTVLTSFSRSLLFLNTPIAEARRAEEAKTKEIQKFIVNGSDEIEIQVDNVVLVNITNAPYSAQVDIEKIYRGRTGNENRLEKYTVSIVFAFAKQIPNDVIKVNPLGFTVMNIRQDQSFR